MDHLDQLIWAQARDCRPLAERLLREAIRIPADFVDRPAEEGGDRSCGLSNHEGPRLEYFRRQLVEIGAVDSAEDCGFDDFGNLWWQLEDSRDGVPPEEKKVIWLDGHSDTVQALRERWQETIGGGIDAYEGLRDGEAIDRDFLRRELGYLPADGEWEHLVWGRGAADQLGGVVCQMVASKILRELRPQGLLKGVVLYSLATVAEEDNDGGGPMWAIRQGLAGAGAERLPDVILLTEGTGCARDGALGIYRGQRGRMQIEVEITGKSCHGSMPHEGRNPLEFGSAILAEAAQLAAEGRALGEDAFLGRGSRTASQAWLDTPSDCAVPERFTFRFDRRLTVGEDPQQACADIEDLSSVRRAREAGLGVEVRVPIYDMPTWRNCRPGNAQIYPGWTTPEDHHAILSAVETYRRVISPHVESSEVGGSLRREPRVSRWVFSTDGVGVPVPKAQPPFDIPGHKEWVEAGAYTHPPMFGIGPGIEQNTHKIGECVDGRELAPVIAFYVRFPSLFAQS